MIRQTSRQRWERERLRELQKCKLQIANIENCNFAICILHFSICSWFGSPSARLAAAERPLRFIHVLQKNGYGDMAVQYLEILAKRPDLPPEVRDVWDLEMSRSLRAEAADGLRRQGPRPLDGGVAAVPGEVHPGEARQSRHGDGHGRLGRVAGEAGPRTHHRGKGPGGQGQGATAEDLGGGPRTVGPGAGEVPAGPADVQGAAGRACRPPRSCPPRRRSAPKPWKPGATARPTWKRPSISRRWWTTTSPRPTSTRRAPSAPRALRKAAEAFDDIFQRDRMTTPG